MCPNVNFYRKATNPSSATKSPDSSPPKIKSANTSNNKLKTDPNALKANIVRMETQSRKSEFIKQNANKPKLRNRLRSEHNLNNGPEKGNSRASSKNVNPIVSQMTSYRGGSFGETNSIVNEPESAVKKKNSLFSAQSSVVSPGVNKFGSSNVLNKQTILLKKAPSSDSKADNESKPSKEMSGRNLKSVIKEESEKDDDRENDSDDYYTEISEQKQNNIEVEKRISNTQSSKLAQPLDIVSPSFNPHQK